MLNKIKGGIFGVAVGDALGCTAEFMTPDEISAKFGRITEILGGGPFLFAKGEYTDDTAMTLCVANGILSNPANPLAAIGDEFLAWFETRPKDIGMTVLQSISAYYKHKDWSCAAEQAHTVLGGKSAGNGSLMRCLPVALAYRRPSDILRVSRAQSKLTHFDNKASEACVIYNVIAHHLLSGFALDEAIINCIEGTVYSGLLHNDIFGVPDGYVENTLRWALHILINTNSYEEAVQRAANAGYDTDTLTAVVGGLAGVYYGFDAIPERYVDALLKREELRVVSIRLCELRETYS